LDGDHSRSLQNQRIFFSRSPLRENRDVMDHYTMIVGAVPLREAPTRKTSSFPNHYTMIVGAAPLREAPTRKTSSFPNHYTMIVAVLPFEARRPGQRPFGAVA
jgi:hypothetical protein